MYKENVIFNSKVMMSSHAKIKTYSWVNNREVRELIELFATHWGTPPILMIVKEFQRTMPLSI